MQLRGLRGLLVLAVCIAGCDDTDSDARARIERLEAQVAALTAANLDGRVTTLENNVGTGLQDTLATLQSQVTAATQDVTSLTNYLEAQRGEALYVFDGADHLLGRLISYDPESTSVLFLSSLSSRLIETALDPVQARTSRGAFVYPAAVGGCTGTPHYTTNQLTDAGVSVETAPLALEPQRGSVWARTGAAEAFASTSSFSIGTGGLCIAETLNEPAYALTLIGTFSDFTPGVKIAKQDFSLP